MKIEVGGVYKNGIGEVSILLGKSRGMYLVIVLHKSQMEGKYSFQEILYDAMKPFENPCAYPYFQYKKIYKPLVQLGVVSVPAGITRQYEKRVKSVQQSAMTWNTATLGGR